MGLIQTVCTAFLLQYAMQQDPYLILPLQPLQKQVCILLCIFLYFIFFTLSVPSAPPSNLAEVNRTLFNITIMWQPVNCIYHNGIVQGYGLRYNGGNITKVNASTSVYTITDLLPSTKYVIEVAAMNRIGIGIFGTLNISTLPCKFGSFTPYLLSLIFTQLK